MNNSRIYNKKINLKHEAIAKFWFNQAAVNKQLNSVLLGSQKDNQPAILRNELENSLLHDLIDKHVSKKIKLQILDLGCGLGRWYMNFKEELQSYFGTDFSPDYIKYCQEHFHAGNAVFTHRDLCKPEDAAYIFNHLQSYNLIIITGVLMYLNDADINQVFTLLNKYAAGKAAPVCIYIQESAAWHERLTLDEFQSSELNAAYNAIYRTSDEYLKLIQENLSAFKLIAQDQFLTDKNWPYYQKDSETYTQYFFLSSGED